MTQIGFARVSTREQDLTAQLESLKTSGCDEIFYGKQSGDSSENDLKLDEMIRYIRKDDIVVVTKLDRLGRSLRSILSTIDAIHSKKATLRSLDGAIDTSNNSPFAKAQLSLIGTFAQLERDLIIDRTSEGRERAMKAGVEFGRPPLLSDEQKMKIIKSYDSGNGKTMLDLARKFNVSRMTISRVVRSIDNG